MLTLGKDYSTEGLTSSVQMCNINKIPTLCVDNQSGSRRAKYLTPSIVVKLCPSAAGVKVPYYYKFAHGRLHITSPLCFEISAQIPIDQFNCCSVIICLGKHSDFGKLPQSWKNPPYGIAHAVRNLEMPALQVTVPKSMAIKTEAARSSISSPCCCGCPLMRPK